MTINQTSEEVKIHIWKILETVFDPEVPVISVVDLGVVRDILILPTPPLGGWGVEVLVTPTYTGCPAMDVMKINIRMALLSEGFTDIKITPSTITGLDY